MRHGESTWVAEGRFQGRKDPPLSQLGMRQARLVAERLAARDEETPLPIPAGPPRGVWHSPLRRAADTAKEIARALPGRTPLHGSDGLTEIAQGEWEGQPAQVVRTRWATELAAWRKTPVRSHAPGGESLSDAAARVRMSLLEIMSALIPDSGGDRPGSDSLGGRVIAPYDPVPGYPSALPAENYAPEPWAVLVAHDGIFRLVLLSLLRIPIERFWALPFNLAAISVVALHEGVAALRAHNLSDHLAPLAQEERAAQESRGERRGAL